MTDYNSMKADGYAQRQGEIDEFEHAIDVAEVAVLEEVPEWIHLLWSDEHRVAAREEARRRVMQAIKERSEP